MTSHPFSYSHLRRPLTTTVHTPRTGIRLNRPTITNWTAYHGQSPLFRSFRDSTESPRIQDVLMPVIRQIPMPIRPPQFGGVFLNVFERTIYFEVSEQGPLDIDEIEIRYEHKPILTTRNPALSEFYKLMPVLFNLEKADLINQLLVWLDAYCPDFKPEIRTHIQKLLQSERILLEATSEGSGDYQFKFTNTSYGWTAPEAPQPSRRFWRRR